MAEYSKLYITNNGQALMAKMIAGSGNIDFTKICSSATQYSESQLQALTALSNIKQTTLVSKVTRTNEVAIKIEAALSNVDLKEGYYMRTLGLYAVDPDKGEILYAVCIEKSNNCYMPPYNGVTVSAAYLQLYTTVGNADSVSLAVSPGAYATVGDIQALENEIADLKAFVGYSDGDIYGVEVDFENKKFTRLAGAVNRSAGSGFDNIKAFGGRKRCNVANDGTVTAYYGEAGFVTTGKNSAGNAVQVMVEQPKFYYKVVPMVCEKADQGMKIRKARYYVSDTPKAGFKVHPAFVENGKENDKIYLAAFEGSLWDNSANAYILDDSATFDTANDMLSSIANAKPISGLGKSLTRKNTRLLAEKRGSGWEQAYAATVAASQLLMLIEYASFNMQSAIGAGVTNKTDDGSTSMTEITGATVNLGNASGSVTNANGYNIVSYRGEENIWGNIWAWVDGMNEKNPTGFADGQFGTLYVADHSFADGTDASPYKNTGIHPCYGGGYTSAFGYSEEFDWLFIPVEKNGNSSLPVGDYFWNANDGWRVAILGGRWNNGAIAGAFCWFLDNGSGYYNRDIGGRLVYVPSKKTA